jgi:hypothetical protein
MPWPLGNFFPQTCWETAYQYIEFRGEEQAEIPTLTMENITNYIPKHCAVLLHTNDKVTFIVPTQFLCNGNILSKKVTIHNFEWNLSIREKDIELDSIGLDNIFDWTIDGMNKVLSIVFYFVSPFADMLCMSLHVITILKFAYSVCIV